MSRNSPLVKVLEPLWFIIAVNKPWLWCVQVKIT